MRNPPSTLPEPAPAIGAHQKAAPGNAWIYLKLVLVALMWGGTFVAGRTIAQQMPMTIAATLRYAVAVPVLLLIAWKMEGGLPRLTARQAVTTFALGLTGIFIYNVCFFAALSRMPAGRTALFVALNPVVTALLLAIVLRERLRLGRWLGIAVAFLGAAVVITRGDLVLAWRDISASFGVGEAMMFCGVSSWAAYTIIGRFSLRGLTPIAATTYATLWGWLLLAGGAALEFDSFDPAVLDWQALAAIAYLGVFGTAIALIWYYQGVKAIGPARTAVFNNLVPVFGVALSAVLLSEPILSSMVAGGALVIAGVTLTNRQPLTPSRHT
ncbi:MAG: DMT family transporter [Noviherbaspirillum sp.]